MAQSTVTRAFEAWNVSKILDGLPAVPDKVVFALVPDQDETVPVNRDEGMPIAAYIKHTADITQAGVLNDNSVVYSVVLDTTIGDWDYNWIGLVDSSTDTVLMVVHVRIQQKLKTYNGQQGNNLTRNLSMQFDGAAEATQINVSAQTWQIDFSARLFSMDEAHRLAMQDYYGAAAFLNDGLKVTLAGTQATVAPGVGYVGGLRVQLDDAQTVTATANTSVWLDVSRQGTVTGAWGNRVVIKAANTLENYIDGAGYRHYVTKLATITNGQLTDARPVSPIVALDERFLPIKGTAVAASKLATARKIAGVLFDGTKDIALSAEDVGIVIQTDPVDTTQDALMGVGAFGLGAQATDYVLGSLNDATRNGFFRYTAGAPGSPSAVAGFGVMFGYDTNTQGQLVSGAGENGLKFRRKGGGGWLSWTTLVDAENTQTISGVKTFSNYPVSTGFYGKTNEATSRDIFVLRGTPLAPTQAELFASSSNLFLRSPTTTYVMSNAVFTGAAWAKNDNAVASNVLVVAQSGVNIYRSVAGNTSPIQYTHAVLASGLNAVVDSRGYWKTPASAELTPASMGAISITELAGIPLPFPGAVAPTGWLKCNGQAFDKTLYPVLAARYPTGNLPDLRAEFIRGWDDGRGVDAGRALLSEQADAIRNITGAISFSDDDSSTYAKAIGNGVFSVQTETKTSFQAGVGNPSTIPAVLKFDASTVVPTAADNRPRNIAFNYIVRAA